MEDSYTVHRRRKAAARKREKTPDPPRREDEESGEDDNAARAKMEKMVEDTENMAEMTGKKITENITITEGNFKDKSSARDDEGDETKPSNVETTLQVKNEMASKVETVKKLSSKNEEQDKFRTVLKSGIAEPPRDSDLPTPIEAPQIEDNKPIKESRVSMEKSVPDERSNSSNKIVESGDAMLDKIPSQNMAEPRAKKRSKEKFQAEVKRSYGTDSSDAEERIIPVFIRRKKSPEDESQKIFTGTTESRVKSNRDKRHVSKHRYSTGTEDELTPKKGEVKTLNEKRSSPEPKAKLREKRSVSRHRYPSDTDEDLVMKKSETFPQKCASDKPMIKRSTSEIKKQIIPLSDDSLIQDFAKAQEDYLRRERGILAPDNIDDYASRSESKILRKRKLGVLHADPQEMLKNKENEAVVNEIKKSKSWFNWWPFSRKKVKTDHPSPDKMITIRDSPAEHGKVTFMEFLKALQEILSEFKAYVDQNPGETKALRKLRNCCIGELILIIIYCGLGAFVFRFTEGAFETFYKCGVKRVKRDFLDNLWNYSHNMREEDWKSMARRKLMEFEEQLHSAHEAGVHSYSGQKSWTFLNAVSYCLTVITTIGYGHIAPRTMAGQAITIVYAIFGIPIFLIILADFGKLFTRGIKFLWAFVRRLYYTGSCRKVRRTVPVQEVMKGVQLVYDFATFKRPSQINPEDVEEMQRQQTVLNLDGNAPQPETPGTPAMSNFAIDDEFNLPISVAITILLGYIFVGATAYHMFESWDFFESFYFVFISMSTIGFGDFVPKNPIFMMFSIVYLVFGLALTSMCINVVQTVLSDSFKQASQKISATIGFEVPPEEGEENVEEGNVGEPAAIEISDVQATIVKEAEEIREELQAPKAKQEDVHL